MDLFETTIDDYITHFGTEEEQSVHELYRGEYKITFLNAPKNLEEASAFAGAGAMLFTVLSFVLECVGASLVQGTVIKGKEIILERLQRNSTEIIKKAPDQSTELTKETVENLIALLQKQLSNME